MNSDCETCQERLAQLKATIARLLIQGPAMPTNEHDSPMKFGVEKGTVWLRPHLPQIMADDQSVKSPESGQLTAATGLTDWIGCYGDYSQGDLVVARINSKWWPGIIIPPDHAVSLNSKLKVRQHSTSMHPAVPPSFVRMAGITCG